MPTDKTPQDGDETLALPVSEREPTGDETLALPTTEELPPGDTDDHAPLHGTEPDAAASTSPIGVFTSPPDRTDRPVDDPVGPCAVDEPVRRRLRVGTVVWGLVIAAIGVGMLAWAGGFTIDVQLAMIVLLAAAGTALLLGSLLSGARQARR
ncbi:hypothetical protein [Cellulomonas fengjieae]|uniref:Uncharacterized protein n=1 Tax=Cellulomonas fengjieae TaxID=2819978 RepID=A0ABS3SD15_9CELL|nr:hypothetical protein [Cellulomonas fengjieae]MBO3083633.1 hypothetical protein [Cellulomonas fengjieae]MBO3101616.1 hypothetical protein [Cellulomonas fengjieae]QVI65052.1 hypothetical protein KG102_13030 [Cellulomonas fengjieae]